MATLDNVRLHVVRPDDHVVLSLRFRGVSVTTEADGRRRLDRTDRAVIIVEFPPQAFLEQAFADSAKDPFKPAPPGSVGMRLSGPSQLVFEVPPSLGRIDFSLRDILAACAGAKVSTAHTKSGSPFPASPNLDLHSLLEIPYDVRPSPSVAAGWAHTADPAVGDLAPNSFALWHTRLGVRRTDPAGAFVDEHDAGGTTPDDGRTVRAAWAPVVGDDGLGDNFITTFPDRAQLFDATGKDRSQPPVSIGRLMLSSMGAWLDASWERLPIQVDQTGLTSWRHHMTMGRDHRVRVVSVGWLYPYGHRVARSVISERRIGADGLAYLHRQERLLVRQPDRDFTNDLGMPFRKVRLTTAATPELASGSPRSGVQGEQAFWPMVSANEDFLFDLEVEDRAGTVLRFRAPLIFVTTKADMNTVQKAYEHPDNTSRRVRPMDGRRIVYVAPPDDAGSASFDTASIELTGVAAAPAAAGDPPFGPRLRNAVASVPALRQLTGKEHVGFSYHETYRTRKPSAPNPHPAGVFAVLDAKSDKRVAFGSDVSAGMVSPDMSMTGLSTKLGPVGGGPGDIDKGTFDPAAFFGDAAPRLFGILPLTEMLKKIDNLAANATEPVTNPFAGAQTLANVPASRVPKLVMETPTRTRLQWGTTQLQKPKTVGEFFELGAGALLWLDVVRDTDPTTAVARTSCHLGPFSLNFVLLGVDFAHFRFQL